MIEFVRFLKGFLLGFGKGFIVVVLVAFWIGFEGIGLDLHDFVFD